METATQTKKVLAIDLAAQLKEIADKVLFCKFNQNEETLEKWADALECVHKAERLLRAIQ